MRIRRKGMRILLIAAFLLVGGLALRGDSGWTPRAVRLGNELICTCGCTQGVMVCNHVGCPVVTQMRAEVQQRAASSDSDELILQSFVQEYGTQVLANPTAKGFNLLAWVMPWIALGIGLGMVLGFVRHMRQRAQAKATAAAPDPAAQQIQAEVKADIEAEMGREWKR